MKTMNDVSVISRTTVIRGNLRGEGSLRIDGKVGGHVEVSGDVTLGPDAEVDGNISGATLSIAGSVSGDLTGRDAVLVEASGRVVGDLRAPRIGIAEGALVRGSVQTEGAQAPQRAPARVAQTPLGMPARRVVAQALPTRQAPPPPQPTRVVAEPPRAVSPAPAKEAAKKQAPPPVVTVPSKGARGKKKKTAQR